MTYLALLLRARLAGTVLISLACVSPAWCQTKATIVFSESGAVQLPDIGRVRIGYPVCGPTGTSYFTIMVNPPQSADTPLLSVAKDGTVVFYDVHSIPGMMGSVAQSVAADATGATV